MFQRVSCKVLFYMSYSAGVLTIYLLVAMATDRLIAIKFPIFHRNHSTKKLLDVVIFTIMASSFALVSPAFFFLDINNDGVCIISPKGYPELHRIYSLFTVFVVFFGFPFAMVFLTNISFAVSLLKRRSGSKIKNNQNASNVTSEKAKIEKQKIDSERDFVFMLLILTLSFLVFTLTSGIFLFWNVGLSVSTGPQNDALIEFTENMNSFANIMNNSLNFIFYYVGGRMFRDALAKAIRKRESKQASKK